MASTHIWNFFRAGGFDQVKLDSGADLLALDKLDQKLWVALACPTTGLEFDSKTLALLDTDKDGRIRASELIAAIKWAGACLKNPDDLVKGSSELPLSAINDATPEGKQLLASAKHILASLGHPDATAISLDDTGDTAKIFSQTNFNGDGIVPADSAEDAATKAAITDIIACLGSEPDRSSKPGINQAKADQFFAEAQAYSDWWKKAETDPAILPLGDATSAAAASFQAIKPKVDDYFARCQLAAFDARAVNALNREEKDYLLLTGKDLSLASAEIAALPLAQIAPGKPLPLKAGLNPAWTVAMAGFEAQVVKRLLNGNTLMAESDWAAISSKFAAYEAWRSSKTGVAVEKLGLPRIRELLAGKAKENIAALIAKDKALEPESNAIAAVEKLVRCYRDIYQLTNNFVSFRDFYSRKDKAIFQAGTLYLDQRSCELCLIVEDPGKHAVMAGLAGTYLAYCDCARKGTNEKLQVVAAFTDGDSDNLMAGRNGIFYDRKGRDWDATITKILDNPISIRQAFWSPYKKAARMIQEQIAKRAAAADEESAARLVQAAQKLEQAASQPGQAPAAVAAPPPPPPPPAKKIDPGLIAALGVGAAGIGGMIGGLLSGFLNLGYLMPLGVLAIIFLISGPSMLLAWLKLRKRNLGPILDANGWAVNAKARINVPFGASLTRVATLPPGAHRDLVDPFAEKKSPWPKIIAAIVLLLIVWRVLLFAYGVLDKMGYIYEWTNGRLGEHRPLKAEPGAPAPKAPAATPAKPAEAPK